MSRLNEKTLNPEKYQLHKKSERERLKLHRQRKKLGLIQYLEETTNDTTVPITCEEHQQSTDSSENLKSFPSLFLKALRKLKKPYRSAQPKKRKLSMA